MAVKRNTEVKDKRKVSGLLRGYGVKLCVCGKYYAGDACPACAADDGDPTP